MRSTLPEAALRAVLRPLGEAVGLPAQAYLDPDVLHAEQRSILSPAWTCLGRASDVEAPGSWMLGEVAGSEVVVVRGDDLELRAFYNVCRHRAMPLVHGTRGRSARLSCRYHGWSYDTRGHLASVPGEVACDASIALTALSVATFQGFVLVSAAPAAPMTAWMGVMPPWFHRADLSHVVRGRQRSAETRANWKLVVANFQESHHFGPVHPALDRLTPSVRASTFDEGSVWLGGVMPIDGQTVSRSGTLLGRPRLVVDESPTVYDALLFPAWMTSLQPDYFLSYRLEPIAFDRTRVVADVYFHAAAPRESWSDVLDFWDDIDAQDREICEAQQRGVASAGFVPGRFTARDDGVHAFEARVARALLS